jgi:hypothetical protein
MCCYESTFRTHTRGNIDQFAKIPHLGFSNPEVLEKTDSLYIDLSAKKSSESREVSLRIVLDDDDENSLVGIDIDNTSNKLDLKRRNGRYTSQGNRREAYSIETTSYFYFSH